MYDSAMSLRIPCMLLVWVVLACGAERAPAAADPAARPADPVVEPRVDPEPAEVDVCAPFIARARHVAAVDSGCSTDDQCTCRSGLLFEDCGGPASSDTAHRLSDILRDARAAGCIPPGPRCAPRRCVVSCEERRCVEHRGRSE